MRTRPPVPFLAAIATVDLVPGGLLVGPGLVSAVDFRVFSDPDVGRRFDLGVGNPANRGRAPPLVEGPGVAFGPV